MNRIAKIAAGLAAASVVGLGALMTVPACGPWLYHHAAPAEASLYGLHTEQVKAGDVTFTVYRGGTAPGREAVVLLHGYSADRQVWPRFAKHLLDRYEVIIPDLAGHGDTGFIHGLDYSAPAQARRVVAMLDTLGIRRAHFVGNSMGGFITAHLGLSHADRALSLTLIDPAGVTSPQPSDMERMLTEQHRNPFEVNNREQFREFYAMTMAKPPLLPPSVIDAIADDYQRRRPELAEIFSYLHDRDGLDGHLAEIHVPTLVLWGDQDRLIHVSAAPVWAKGIAGAELHVFPGIGHMPMVEIPAESAAIVRHFLEQHP